MYKTRILLPLALCAALASPVVVLAQQAAQTTPNAGTVAGHRHFRPGLAHKAMHGITLSDAQRQQIRTLVQHYRQDHPQGSPRDPQAAKALRASMLSVLTPDQQAQYLQNLSTMRKHRRAQEGAAPQVSPTPSP
jgi:Spy/CpxP family protein refolding chaperone